jgi:hypothetical protein
VCAVLNWPQAQPKAATSRPTSVTKRAFLLAAVVDSGSTSQAVHTPLSSFPRITTAACLSSGVLPEPHLEDSAEEQQT